MIHRDHWFGSTRPIPQGWDNQIAHGGTFGANLNVRYDRYLLGYDGAELQLFNNNPNTGRSFKPFYLASTLDVNAGNVIGNAGLGLQIGLLNYNKNFGTDNRSEIHTIASEARPRSSRFSAALIITPMFRYVLHNAYLTGKHLGRSSVFTVKPRELINEVFEYDASANFGYLIGKRLQINLSYGLSGRSKEFDFQNKGFHNWGSASLGFTYRTGTAI